MIESMRIPFLFVIVILTCCKEKIDRGYYYREINNEELRKVVIHYAADNNLIRESEFITISFYYSGGAQAYVISKSKSLGGINLYKPDYFSSIDDIVVLLRLEGRQFLDVEGLKNELLLFAKENGKTFKTDLPTAFDPPIWMFRYCDNAYHLLKTFDGGYFRSELCQ
jgi:hypothetical protein